MKTYHINVYSFISLFEKLMKVRSSKYCCSMVLTMLQLRIMDVWTLSAPSWCSSQSKAANFSAFDKVSLSIRWYLVTHSFKNYNAITVVVRYDLDIIFSFRLWICHFPFQHCFDLSSLLFSSPALLQPGQFGWYHLESVLLEGQYFMLSVVIKFIL